MGRQQRLTHRPHPVSPNGPTVNTIELAAASLIGTALVLAPIDPQPIRTLNTPLPEPAPQPVDEPAIVANYDHHGTLWGHDTITKTQADITHAHAHGSTIHEWHVTDPDGQPLRIVRTIDPTTPLLGTDISVIPMPPLPPKTLQTAPAA